MKRDVLVSIRGLQTEMENDQDVVEVLTNGRFNRKGGKNYLRFEEVSEDMGVTKSLLTFDENSLVVTRRGASQFHMTFLKDQKTMTNYVTPFGQLLVGVNTKDISVSESDGKIQIGVNYALEMNHEYITDCELAVDITSR